MKNSILLAVIILASFLNASAKSLNNTPGNSNYPESNCKSVLNSSIITLCELWNIGNNQIFKIKEQKIKLFFNNIFTPNQDQSPSNQNTSELHTRNWNFSNQLNYQFEVFLGTVNQIITSLLKQ
jgi:hypothetical protein